MKKVSFGKTAMEAMVRGLDIAADAVTGTMGPKGRNVYLMDALLPKIVNDGVTVANKITLADPEEDAGAYVIRNVSSQQNDDVGDGTTTVCLLTQAIVHECLKRPENPMEIRESLNKAAGAILRGLAKKSIKIGISDAESIALISAESNELARLIGQIINKLGPNAVITVEDSKTFATEYEIVDGYEAPVGFISPHFVNDKRTGRATYTDVPVLVSQKRISNIQDIHPIFEQFKEHQIGSCVIVCDDIDDSMVGMLALNKISGMFNSLVIRASADTLRDIEGATGATAISDQNGVTFQNIQLEHLGKAKKVVCDANKTSFFVDGKSAKMYASVLERQAENEPNMYLKRKLEDRVAKLRGGVAILKVGAPTDFERDYMRLKAEDAVKAVQAAIAEGVVEGGGMCFWRIAQEMKPKHIGDEILKKALVAPLRKIIENCGRDYAEIILKMPDGEGYDAKKDAFTDMPGAGIMDPSKVERCALENAVSAAGTFITTFCTITDMPEEKAWMNNQRPF